MTHFQEQAAVRSALSESRKRFTVESDGWYYVRDNVTNERVQFLDFVSAMEYARAKNNAAR